MVKLFLTDFDGTLTKEDTLDYICSFNNKLEESRKINEEFLNGNDTKGNTLSRRIQLLKGLNVNEINNKLNYDLLRNGVIELFEYLGSKNVDILICSGNIMPVLHHYKEFLGNNVENKVHIDILGTEIEVTKDNIITGISLTKHKSTFKKEECEKYIFCKNYSADEIVVFGDSISDIEMMKLAKNRFFISPKNKVDKKVSNSKTVSTISELIQNIESLMN